jgi:hypothetical protein
MFIIANVIFPAFATPYVSAMLFPLAAVTALVVEMIVFRVLNHNLSWARIAGIVVVINILSAVVGCLVALILPSGYETALIGREGEQFETFQPGPDFITYAALGYLVAYMLSILVEWGILKSSRQKALIEKPFVTVAAANTASYAVLVVPFVAPFVWAKIFT